MSDELLTEGYAGTTVLACRLIQMDALEMEEEFRRKRQAENDTSITEDNSSNGNNTNINTNETVTTTPEPTTTTTPPPVRYRPEQPNFNCGYSTVWKLSNFPAILILREINFG